MAVYPLHQIKILNRYIEQICSCSQSRAVAYYDIRAEESEQMRNEFIKDVNSILAKLKAA